MDIKRFFKLLKRYAWILILLPILAVTLTYFLSKNLPKEYRSEVQIATGLVDQSKQLSSQTQNDYFKTSQQFSNIIEKLKMRKIMSILSYNLIIHDLENPKSSFRTYSKKLDSLSAADKAEVINIYKQKLLSKTPITVYDNAGKYKLYDMLGSMGYDEGSINKKLAIYRSDNSDFINLEFVSENPLLSPYLVNTLASEFIRSYSVDVYTNQNNSITLLDSLLKKKELDMNSKNAALKNFKMKNGVLNLDAQSSTVYAQISQNEDKKAVAIQQIQANQGALAAINSRLRGNKADPYLGGNAAEDNGVIIRLRNQLKVANDKYIDGNFRPADKKKVDSIQNLLSVQSVKNSDNNVVDPLVSKQSLIQQKLALEISTSQIKNTISSIDKELKSLKAQYNTMVPFDANIQNFERDADIATKDYMAALDRTNQGRTEQNTGLKLQIAQIGLPGVAQASKALIYVALSGIATFSFCFMVLVVLFLLDGSIYNTAQLAKETGGPVLGFLNLIKDQNKEPRAIWQDNGDSTDYSIYKDLLRSLRFEIDKEFTNDKCQILGVTSLNSGEGKSFLSSSLVYAFAMTGKKVLLISSEEGIAKPNSQKMIANESFDTFIVKKEFHTEDLITVFNSQSNNSSLLEFQSSQNLKMGFDVLRKEFDFILIDINSLKEMNKAKEWLYFTDKSIAVYEYGNVIKDIDKEGIAYIKQQPGFMGWILNKVKES